MKAYGTYFQNDPKRPLVYGEVELINPPRQRLRGEPPKEGILAHPVMVGFCGTDYELMKMGSRGELGPKFPAGQNRLINGHEGVVWVPEQNRFAIVLIRGGDSVDPTRYTEDETYFEYGCDQADGLFCDSIFVNPDMLLSIPDGYVRDGKLALSFAKKMVFPDPFACMLFQLERMEDLGSAHLCRRTARVRHCGLEEARRYAEDEVFVLEVGVGNERLEAFPVLTYALELRVSDILALHHLVPSLVSGFRTLVRKLGIEFLAAVRRSVSYDLCAGDISSGISCDSVESCLEVLDRLVLELLASNV